MAKKGGNKKKSVTSRNGNKKKIVTPSTTSADNSAPPSPTSKVSEHVDPVPSTPTKDAELILAATAAATVVANIEKKEEQESIPTEQVKILERKDTLEEPPHVEVKAEPIVVTLDNPGSTQNVDVVLEKSVLPEEVIESIIESIDTEEVASIDKIESKEPIHVEEAIKAEIDESLNINKPVEVELPIKAEVPIEVELPIKTNELKETDKPVEALVSVAEPAAVEEIIAVELPVTVQVPITVEVPITAEVEEALKSTSEPIEIQESIQIEEPVKIAQSIEIEVPTSTDPKQDEATQLEEQLKIEPVTKEAPAIIESASADKPIEITKEETTSKAEPSTLATSVENHTDKQDAAQPALKAPAEKELPVLTSEKEPIILINGSDSAINEEAPTLKSQSLLTEQSTIDEESHEVKDHSAKDGFVTRSKSVAGEKKEKQVTKRKSQIMDLFKRSGDKEKTNVPVKDEKKRKSWMFWKSSTPKTSA